MLCLGFFTERYHGIYWEALYAGANQRLNSSGNIVLVGTLGVDGTQGDEPPQVSHEYSLQSFLFWDINLCPTERVLMGRFFCGGCEGPDEKSILLWWV